jgi:uncharacterized protein (DUF433 family)
MATVDRTLDSCIECTPGVLGGKPRIAGRRIAVQSVAIWHERMGLPVERIAEEYDLTPAEVHAALAYYFLHREEIDKNIEEGRAFVEEMKQQYPSKLPQRLKDLLGDAK